VSTTTKPSFPQPALIGGLVMGVLASLPIIGPIGNVCCCLWAVTGGVVAAYILQQNLAGPLSTGDGALVGLLAGLAGAVAHTVVSIPLDLILGPMERQIALRFIERLPPDLREMMDRVAARDVAASAAVFIISHIVGLMIWLFAGAIFSTIGGVIGAALFKKSGPPPGVIDVPTTPSPLA
jgi:hypothetical protein